MRNSPNRTVSCRDVRGAAPVASSHERWGLNPGKNPFFGKKKVKKEALIQYLQQRRGEQQYSPAPPGRSQGGSGMPEQTGTVFPMVVPASLCEKQQGRSRPLVHLTHQPRGCIRGWGGCVHRLPRHSTARKQSHAKSTPHPRHLEASGEGARGGLQTTSYSLRAGNSASFYQTPHQSFYISLPSVGSTQTLHPLPGSRTPCASCSAPVTFGGGMGDGHGGGVREGSGDEVGGKSNRRKTKQKRTYNEGFPAKGQVLTPYRLNRISRSSLPLRYLSSIKGLWSIESSPSGSGLSQPLKPFFLNV